MVKDKSKVAIIGAGNVGSSTAFAIALNQQVNELVLIDVNKDKARGEALDINHGLSFVGQMSLYQGDYKDCRDCDVIIIASGISRKPGETRMDLAKKNTIMAKDVIKNVMKYYTTGVVLAVSNPVDILTYIIQKFSGLPYGRVLGSGTVLDSSRFRYLLGRKLNVDIRNVHGYIIGEHGDTQLPAWSATHIAGQHIDEYCLNPDSGFREEDKATIAEKVKNAGAEIIKNKGSTHYAIAIAVSNLVDTLLKNQNTIRTVSSVINGQYGINDVAISLPSIINSNGIEKVLELRLSKDEEAALRNSAEKVKSILNEVKDL
ncbi:MAG: L-lactate dehydrogenase [Clostridiaceae bacterium]|nr:L-lactate dehydrogenase [Clostridiaceae bacterium]